MYFIANKEHTNRTKGHPLLLRELNAEVKGYVENIHKLSRVVNTTMIILGATEGILGNKDRTLFDALAPGKIGQSLFCQGWGMYRGWPYQGKSNCEQI